MHAPAFVSPEPSAARTGIWELVGCRALRVLCSARDITSGPAVQGHMASPAGAGNSGELQADGVAPVPIKDRQVTGPSGLGNSGGMGTMQAGAGGMAEVTCVVWVNSVQKLRP